MSKASLGKIILALLICNVYAFSTGVVGRFGTTPVEVSAPEQPAENDEIDEGAEGQGTVDFFSDSTEQTVINVDTLHFASPSLSEMMVYTTFFERESDTEPTEADDINEGAFEEESFNIVDTYEPEDEDTSAETEPVHTTAATTAATKETAPPADEDIPDEEEPPKQTTVPTTTTAATTTTTTTTAATTTATTNDTTDNQGGIPVENDNPAVTTTTTTQQSEEQQPIEIITDANAANELLTVNNGGSMLTGTALDIIAGITQTEVGHTFAPEAIKAQAVAAYSYVKFCNAHSINPNVIVSSNVSDSVRVLVASVIGQAVYYNGSIIQATYTASSAGNTASSENVWGTDYPYLRSVYCELDAKYDPNYGKTKTFSADEIKQRVYEKTGISLSGDPSEWFSIDSRYDGKYVAQLNIGGYHSYTDSSGSTVKITGRTFREKIMSFDIRSNAFDIEYDADSDSFTITTYGYGHGVGMSQNGANALATYWGYTYKQILQFYYSGTEVY
ncbi:MAG: SpoIID/LytB domain-containing protein [Oscillospiraceae bacterium]